MNVENICDRKRVTVVSTDWWLDKVHGGSILSFFESLSLHKYSVDVFVPSGASFEIYKPSFLVTAAKSRKIVFFSYFTLLLRATMHAIATKPYVLFFDHSLIPCFLFIKIIRRTKGIMLILSKPLKKTGFRNWLDLLQFRLSLIVGRLFVDIFTAISPFEAIELSKLGNIPMSHIKIVPPSIGKNFDYIKTPKNVNYTRSNLQLNSLLGKKILLYHGSLDERRGLKCVLKTFEKSCKQDDVVLLVVGSGRGTHLVEDFIKQKNSRNILFLGPMPYSKMPEIVAACDIGLVLLPDDQNWRYQTPTKLIEFLALNKPVIASDLAGIRWVAQNSPLVVYVKPLGLMSVGEFTKALEKAMARTIDEHLNFSNSPYSGHQLFDGFSSDSIAASLNQIINSLK